MVGLACILKVETRFPKGLCVGMRNELRIWSEHLAGPPCPAPFVQGVASRRSRFAGSRGNDALEAWEQRCGAGG